MNSEGSLLPIVTDVHSVTAPDLSACCWDFSARIDYHEVVHGEGGERRNVPRSLSAPVSHESVPNEELTPLHFKIASPGLPAASQDVRSHGRLESVSPKPGRGQRSQKLWVCGWEGPALLTLVSGLPHVAEPPGPRSASQQSLRRAFEKSHTNCVPSTVYPGESHRISLSLSLLNYELGLLVPTHLPDQK